MIRTLTALAALASVAAAAAPAAAEVRINIAGKDAATVDALVRDAAKTACREELRGSMQAFSLQVACVNAAISDAMTQVKAIRSTTYAAAATPLAVTRISAAK